ncbi:MerR family transcriptional regulator [Acetobacterium wieringae]|uniref:Multidrug-efflux transporter 1 regulator n=1 Tax=Acetobacterium wieringae TaxID=52694 RepID=A0A1F2PHS6_9FIRM|nr:MerR family transcriptional regulator [Acetobacterium wieringae]OFV70494.1 multidrug-efflux transporter 1 regulator [Acetobacterium wieringae]
MNETYQCQRVETVYYKIGLFSKINRVTIKALRYYDEIGLLPPAFIEETTGYRYYTSSQLPLLHQILALRDMGFTLDEIKQVQGGIPEKELLQKKRLELIKKIAADTLRLAQVESYLAKKDADTCDYHIILKDLPEVIVASMRTVISSYDALFDVVPPMGAEMERLGCVCAVPEYCFNIYHDGEYRETDVDVEICEAVTEKKIDSEMLTFKVIDRVEHAACVLHKGPYEGFPKAYNAVLKWVENNGYEIIDNPRESYIDGLWNKDSAEDWLTEIQFPVRKIS